LPERRDRDPRWADRKASRGAFFKRFRREAAKVKPKFVKIPPQTDLFDFRNRILSIREGAKRVAKIRLAYKSIRTGEWKTYLLEPYAFRHRRTEIGRVRVLYAYHGSHKRIHMFIMRNIGRVFVTALPFQPRWPVEIK